MAKRVEALLRQGCEVRNWPLHELNVQPDHLHLLLQIPPSVSVAKVVNLLKGRSSRLLRLEFPELEEFLWGESFWCDGYFVFWCDGYFVESVGQTEEGVIRRYIQDQGKTNQDPTLF